MLLCASVILKVSFKKLFNVESMMLWEKLNNEKARRKKRKSLGIELILSLIFRILESPDCVLKLSDYKKNSNIFYHKSVILFK